MSYRNSLTITILSCLLASGHVLARQQPHGNAVPAAAVECKAPNSQTRASRPESPAAAPVDYEHDLWRQYAAS
jgi:hypothetical protein